MTNVLSKSDFALLCRVSRGRVSQWLAAGKIDGAAIVGEGRGALIDTDVAVAQLKERLDVSQRFSNGLSTRLDGDVLPPGRVKPANRLAPTSRLSGGASLGSEPVPSVEPADTVEAQIKAEKLRQAQFLSSRLEVEDWARRGVYIEASEARGEMTRIASEMLKTFEGSFPDFASALAAKYQIPSREVLNLLRTEFRRIREQLAAAHGAAASSILSNICCAA